MKVVTSQQMRALDARAMDEGGLPGVVLMENAGIAVARAAARLGGRRASPAGLRACVVCGTGNNGGDGFVAARHLYLAGAAVRCHLAGDAQRLAGDALTNWRALKATGVEVGPLPRGGTWDVAVDAVLGTGARGAPRGPAEQAIEWLARQACPVLAVDVPSGVNADTGAVEGACVRAASTITFGYPKVGLFMLPGAERVGEIAVDTIGFDWERLQPDTPYRWVDRRDVAEVLPRRARESNKGTYGHVLVVGGSTGMSGAPSLTARAALRAGAGLVTVAAPETAQRLVAVQVGEAMTVPLPEDGDGVAASSAARVLEAAERADVVCLGPGMGRGRGVDAVVMQVLERCKAPVVLDADGLNALAREGLPGPRAGAPLVLTPHPGEAGRLLERDTAQVQADRLGSVQALGSAARCVALLKGARTLVCDGRAAGTPVAISTTGNPGMATGGCGDALTGIVGALIGQGATPFGAAWAGAWMHGLAGDEAARTRGLAGMTAGDLVEALPAVLKALEEDPS